MADRFPIILNTSANQLQEMPAGDSLDISGAAVKANLVDSLSVVGTGVSVAGIVTATSFVGSGANLSGIDISAVKDSGGNVKIQAEASGAIYTGIHTFGSTTSFTNGVFNGTVTSTGAVVNGDSDLNGDIDVEGDLDVDGHTNLDNVSISGITTAFRLRLEDNRYLQIGNDSDLQLYHDASNSYIADQGTGSLFVSGSAVRMQSDDNRLNDSSGNVIIKTDSNTAYLYYNGVGPKLQTTSNGILINGAANIENDGSNITVGGLGINQTIFHRGDTNTAMDFSDNDRVRFRTGGVERLAITNGGVHINVGVTTIAQELDVDGHTNLDNVSVAGVTTFASGINCSTDGVGNGINIGAGSDLILQHNGTNSFIDNNTGDLYIQTTGSGDDIFIESADDFFLKVNGTDNAIQAYGGAYVELRFNNESKIRTTSEGIEVLDTSSTASTVKMNTSGGYAGALYAVNNNTIALTAANYNWVIKGNSGGSTELYHTGNAKKLETTTTGITVTGNVVSTGADINGDIDVDGHTNLDNLSVAGVSTFTGAINGSSAAFSGNATITGNLSVGGVLTYEDVKNVDSVGIATARVGLKVLAGGANVVGVVTASNGIFVPDSQAIHLGNVSGGGDLQLTHNGSHSYIKDSGTGNLLIQGSQVALQSTSGENMVTALADGAVQLMYDHSAKLATTNTGVSITGNIAVSGTVDGVDIASFKTSFDNLNTDLGNDTSPQLGGNLDVNTKNILFGDSSDGSSDDVLIFGAGSDFKIYHNGHNIINGATGQNLEIQTNAFRLRNQADSESMIVANANDSVELYHDNTKRFETTANGVEVSAGRLDVGSVTLSGGGLALSDNDKVVCGNGDDLEIYHSGTESWIKETGTGNLYIASNKIVFQNGATNEETAIFNENGAVELYYDDSKKFETTSSGITVTGNATATTFIGALTGTASGNTTITNNADNRVVTGGSGNALNGESTLNYGSNVLSFNGTASVLSGTGNTFGGYLYRDGGSGYFYIDALTTSSYTCGFKIRGYQNGTYTEHLQGFAGTTKIGSGGSSDRLVIQSNGQISVGGDTVRTINSHAPRLQVQGNNYSDATVSIINNANSQNGAYLFLGKQRSGSAGGNTIVQSNDIIGQIRFNGADGTDLENPMAYIECRVDGTPGSNDMPGRLMFYTTPDGGTSPTARMVIKNNGRVGINETNPSESLYVAGNIYATGNVTAYSDIRVKENVKEISNALEAVDKIRGVSYTRKDTKEDTLGVSAQEVETMFPELVVEDNHGMKSVNYNGLVGVLFSAVKELSTKLKEIENK